MLGKMVAVTKPALDIWFVYLREREAWKRSVPHRGNTSTNSVDVLLPAPAYFVEALHTLDLCVRRDLRVNGHGRPTGSVSRKAKAEATIQLNNSLKPCACASCVDQLQAEMNRHVVVPEIKTKNAVSKLPVRKDAEWNF